MYKVLITCLILFSTLLTQAQIAELEKRNGFKDIKLGSPVDSIVGIKFKRDIKEKNMYEAKSYSVSNPDYANIGEVKVKDVGVKAYQDLIYEINVVTDKDPRLMKALQTLYGKAEYDMKQEMYFWKGKDIILTFQSKNKNSLELTFSSLAIHAQMKTDKENKVTDIANDF
jgi:hypothetical protein